MFSFLKIMEYIKLLLEKDLILINCKIKKEKDELTNFCSLPELQKCDWQSFDDNNFSSHHSGKVLMRENYKEEVIRFNDLISLNKENDTSLKPVFNCFYYPQLCCHLECAYNNLQLLRGNLKRSQKTKRLIIDKLKEINLYLMNKTINTEGLISSDEENIFEMEF